MMHNFSNMSLLYYEGPHNKNCILNNVMETNYTSNPFQILPFYNCYMHKCHVVAHAHLFKLGLQVRCGLSRTLY